MADSTLSFSILAKDNASSTITRVGQRFGALHLSVGKVAKGIAAVGPALAGLAVGAGIKQFIDDARESAKVGRITEQVVRSTGGAAKITADQVGELATAISNKTGADDEAIQSGQNLLLTFTNIKNGVGKGNDIFNQASQAITDMTAAMNGGEVTAEGMKTSSIQLGKALNDPIKGVTALQKVGVSFTQSQKDQIKSLVDSGKTMEAQKIILRELNKEFGGAAAAAGDPFTKLQTVLGNLSEEIGGFLLPVADKFATVMTSRIIPAISGLANLIIKGDFTSELGDALGIPEDSGIIDFLLNLRSTVITVFKQVGDRIAQFGKVAFGTLTSQVLPAIVKFAGFVKSQFTQNILPAVRNLIDTFGPLAAEVKTNVGGAFTVLVPKVVALGKTIASVVGPALRNFTGFLKEHGTIVRSVAAGVAGIAGAMLVYKGVLGAVAIATKAYAAVQAALNLVLSLNPIGIVVLALAGLAAGLIYAYKHSEKFRQVVNTLGGALKSAFLGVVGFVRDTIRFFRDLPGNVTKALGDTSKWLLKKGQDFITGLMNGIWSIAKGIDSWMMRAPVAKILAPWYGAAKWLIPHGVKFLQGFLNGVVSIAKTVGSWMMRNVINPAVGAFGAAGTWLVNQGRNFIAGLIAGVTGYMRAIGSIGGWLYNHVAVPAVTAFNKAASWLDRAGRDLIGGLVGGIAERMKGIGSWLKTNVVDPIVSGVKKFFGIKSPSTVFAGIGGHLIDGLMKGLSTTSGAKIAAHIFGDMPSALRAIVGKGLISLNNLPSKALNALGNAVGAGQPLGGPVGNTSNEGIVRTLAAQYGWASGAQWNALRSLIMGESGFRNTAQNPTSSAYGLFQFLDSTWASVGASKTSDPWAQTIAGLKYIARSYGSPSNAYAKWTSRSPHWYEKGTPWVPNDQLAFLHKGEAVIPRKVNEARLAAAGAQPIVWRVESGGSRMDDFLVEMIRRYVKIKGGNVQKVLGP